MDFVYLMGEWLELVVAEQCHAFTVGLIMKGTTSYAVRCLNVRRVWYGNRSIILGLGTRELHVVSLDYQRTSRLIRHSNESYERRLPQAQRPCALMQS